MVMFFTAMHFEPQSPEIEKSVQSLLSKRFRISKVCKNLSEHNLRFVLSRDCILRYSDGSMFSRQPMLPPCYHVHRVNQVNQPPHSASTHDISV